MPGKGKCYVWHCRFVFVRMEDIVKVLKLSRIHGLLLVLISPLLPHQDGRHHLEHVMQNKN